jgi:hypothetical protein
MCQPESVGRSPHVIAAVVLSAYALAAGGATAATLGVGPGKAYKTIAAAVAAAHDGDTIDVVAGKYVNDFAEINKKITLQASGGFAHMEATGLLPNHKAILITDTDITIRNFWFSGARVSEADGGNGAGIRYQGGNLSLYECYFTNSQNGIMGVGDGKGTVTVERSEFYDNGAKVGPSAGYTHNLYLGGLAKLEIADSYFHGANVGHELKSRAAVTTIRNSRVVDGRTGTASYSIDLPNGGTATIVDTQIEQGPKSGNPIMVSFGEEGNLHAGSSLTFSGGLIENDLHNPAARGFRTVSGKPVEIKNARIHGLNAGTLVDGPSSRAGLTYLSTEPAISTKHPWEK